MAVGRSARVASDDGRDDVRAMRSKRSIGAVGLAWALLAGCAEEGGVATSGVVAPALSGEWSVTAAPAAERAVLGGRLTLAADRSWRLRYDYRAEGTEQVWSSGLSGRWELQPGEPAAVRFEVLDDRSTAVGLLRGPDAMEVSLGGLALRLARTPE